MWSLSAVQWSFPTTITDYTPLEVQPPWKAKLVQDTSLLCYHSISFWNARVIKARHSWFSLSSYHSHSIIREQRPVIYQSLLLRLLRSISCMVLYPSPLYGSWPSQWRISISWDQAEPCWLTYAHFPPFEEKSKIIRFLGDSAVYENVPSCNNSERLYLIKSVLHSDFGSLKDAAGPGFSPVAWMNMPPYFAVSPPFQNPESLV